MAGILWTRNLAENEAAWHAIPVVWDMATRRWHDRSGAAIANTAIVTLALLKCVYEQPVVIARGPMPC